MGPVTGLAALSAPRPTFAKDLVSLLDTSPECAQSSVMVESACLSQRVHCTFYKVKFADASKTGQRAASPICTGELRSQSFSLPSPGQQSWDVCLPRVVAMTTSSITSLSASMSLKLKGREGIRTAEWGEGNNYLALPSPPTREEGISLPFHLINGKLCAQKEAGALGGGVAGRGWDSASCPG